MGMHFNIEDSYARLICMVLVIITYSSTMPSLYVFGIITCFTLYWADKYMLVHYYRNPSYMRKEQALKAVYTIKTGVMLHILFGCMMFGQDTILEHEPKEGESVPG